MKVALLTGGGSPHYVLGLLSGLVSHRITIDFIGNDEMKASSLAQNPKVNYLNFRGDQSPSVPMKDKIHRVLRYYVRLLKYALHTDTNLFHIQWLNKFVYFDRTLLNAYYKLLGKKLLFTAHNINQAQRDGNDSILNRLTLRFMYSIVDHIIVHTENMKLQLNHDFKVSDAKVTIIPHGIINVVPKTNLTPSQARQRLHLKHNEKILLFFGNIAPYKGIELLISASARFKDENFKFRLIIAGAIKDCHAYWENIQTLIKMHDLEQYVVQRIGHVPDQDIETYFNAADALILPYKNIFQSGVIFLSYSFGLPVIATDVGSLREDIVEGKSGFLCEAENPEDLAAKIRVYFESDLYKNLEANRERIMKYANEKYSWEEIGKKTCVAYENVLGVS